eukprot:GHVO01062198.1.p1 GENE.GHVO01062198.1~~GHVO01062198.1.p1  ORF type:complete len:195 (-),score=10.50 GHVO01062198.1:352-936(-)
MPVPLPQLGSFNYVPETKENLNWADLVTVDLSLYKTEDGKKQLAQTLINALRNEGFFYVKNFNISQERVDRQFSLGKQFYELPLQEKEKYTPRAWIKESSTDTCQLDEGSSIMKSEFETRPRFTTFLNSMVTFLTAILKSSRKTCLRSRSLRDRSTRRFWIPCWCSWLSHLSSPKITSPRYINTYARARITSDT